MQSRLASACRLSLSIKPHRLLQEPIRKPKKPRGKHLRKRRKRNGAAHLTKKCQKKEKEAGVVAIRGGWPQKCRECSDGMRRPHARGWSSVATPVIGREGLVAVPTYARKLPVYKWKPKNTGPKLTDNFPVESLG